MNRLGISLLVCAMTVAAANAQPLRRLFRPHPAPPPPPPVGTPEQPPAAAPQGAPNVRVAYRVEPKRDVILRWNDVALEAIKAEKTPPPIAAHHLALMHVAIYDAICALEPGHELFAIEAKEQYHGSPEAAAAAAAHQMLTAIYPKRKDLFDRALAESLAWVPNGRAKIDGIYAGRLVANDVIGWRVKNGKMEEVSYKPKDELGKWQPTPPRFAAALLPEWATLACFTVRDHKQFRSPGPPDLKSDEFVAALKKVQELGGKDSKTRTREQTEIAHFWADNEGTVTPPGHWNRIAATVAEKRGLSMDDNARLFALLNVALADAGICCWECKFKCDFWRPVTAIRRAAELKNEKLAADPEWTPLLNTPPFPSYVSGHSTFSGAAAGALAKFFGTDEVSFTTTSDALPGVVRTFQRFSDAAAEAGMSRIYGGIHYDFDNTDGLKVGRDIGEYVAANHFKPMTATRP
jgi:hypothetical protein